MNRLHVEESVAMQVVWKGGYAKVWKHCCSTVSRVQVFQVVDEGGDPVTLLVMKVSP